MVEGPKLLVTFCCGCNEGECATAMDDDASTSGSPKFSTILQGLADCVASHGSGLQVGLLIKEINVVYELLLYIKLNQLSNYRYCCVIIIVKIIGKQSMIFIQKYLSSGLCILVCVQ